MGRNWRGTLLTVDDMDNHRPITAPGVPRGSGEARSMGTSDSCASIPTTDEKPDSANHAGGEGVRRRNVYRRANHWRYRHSDRVGIRLLVATGGYCRWNAVIVRGKTTKTSHWIGRMQTLTVDSRMRNLLETIT